MSHKRARSREPVLSGPCCCCRQLVPLAGFVMLPVRGPVPGIGWGCLVCDLPLDGAVAVLCEECGNSQAKILDAVQGRLVSPARVPLSSLTEPFRHDLSRHLPGD